MFLNPELGGWGALDEGLKFILGFLWGFLRRLLDFESGVVLVSHDGSGDSNLDFGLLTWLYVPGDAGDGRWGRLGKVEQKSLV